MANYSQRVIITDGNGNIIVPGSPNGQQTAANSVPVVIASDQSTVHTQDASDGSASPGTAAAKSMLAGGIYNSTAPTLANGQQAAVQLDGVGCLRVNVNSCALPSGAAQDGTDATGITAPAGGTGIRGWLSGVYNRLANVVSLQFDGDNSLYVNVRDPIAAGSNIIGSVLGRTSAPSVAPTLTASSAYTAGNVVGGLLTFTNAVDAALSGILQRVTINCKSVQTAGFKLYVFSANPSASTFTDKTAPSIASADAGKLVDVISLASPDSGLGTHTLYVADGLADALVLAASSLSAVLVTTGTPTFGSTSDISVSLGILKD